MNFPVASRELVAASRRRATWTIRLSMTAAALLVCWTVMVLPEVVTAAPSLRRTTPTVGWQAFSILAVIAFCYALFAGVFFTADCISQERREGTLGLLYLTRLRSVDLIAGKLAGSSLQAFYGLIAILPAISIPLVAGGVSGVMVAQTFCVLVLTLLLSLSAGILASAVCLRADRAVILALVLILAPALGGTLGTVLCIAPFIFARFRADAGRGYASIGWLLVFLVFTTGWITSVALGSDPFGGSAVLSMQAALSQRGTPGEFGLALLALGVTAALFIYSATLSTEWHLGTKRFREEAESAPARKTTRRPFKSIGENPLAWLLGWQSSYLGLIYISIVLLFVVTFVTGGGPRGMFGGNKFFLVALAPYALLNFGLALQSATPMSALVRTGFLETVLTTPVRLAELVQAQKEIYWKRLKIPVLLMILISSLVGPYSYYILSLHISHAGAEYLVRFIFGWIVFFIHLHALFWVAISFGRQGLTPMAAASQTLLVAFLAPTALTFSVPAAAWSIVYLLGYNSTFYLGWHVAGQVLAVCLYVYLIRWAKASLDCGTSIHSLSLQMPRLEEVALAR